MKKTITLTSGTVARLADSEPFIINANDGLTLEFKSTYYLLSDIIITLKNGLNKGNYRVSERLFPVPEKFLISGKLEISVALIVNGDVAKKWDCVPIIIKETETEVNAFEELAELEKKHEELKKQFDDLKLKYEILVEKFNGLADKHNELAETVSAIKENY